MKNGSVNEIVECLRNGGVVLLPTDTVYGLAVSPNFDESIDRLFALKRRPRNVNLPIMVSSDDELEPLGFQISESARRLLRSPLIPGSLTLALGFSSDYRPAWLEGRDEAAVRSWRCHGLHRGAQRGGRSEVLAGYRLRVATVMRDYGMNEREEAPPDSRAALI